jgi:uncharacterized membrane protein
MNLRSLVSIVLVFGFLAVTITGFCLFFGVKSHAIEAIHILIGILFSALAIIHIVYSFPALKKYFKKQPPRKVISKELIWGLVISIILFFLICYADQFFFGLSHSGRNMFGAQPNKEYHIKK